MKTIQLLIFFQVFNMAFCVVCKSQDASSSKISWNSFMTYDLRAGKPIKENTQLKTYGKDSVQWIGTDGKTKNHFMVKSIRGSWNDVSKPGEILYVVAGPTGVGTLKISSVEGRRAVIRLDINETIESFDYELSVGSKNAF
jgi:hypothetical protein